MAEHLRDLDTRIRQGGNICDSLIAFMYNETLLKRVYSKKKYFVPGECTFCALNVYFFSEKKDV